MCVGGGGGGGWGGWGGEIRKKNKNSNEYTYFLCMFSLRNKKSIYASYLAEDVIRCCILCIRSGSALFTLAQLFKYEPAHYKTCNNT